MPKPKARRNALIIRLWNQGKGNQEILTTLRRAGHKDLADLHSLSGTISRLKRAGKLPRERPGQDLSRVEREGIKEVEKAFGGAVKFKAASPSTSTSTRRMTFWLPGDMIETLKRLAAREKRTASAILREILGKYLK